MCRFESCSGHRFLNKKAVEFQPICCFNGFFVLPYLFDFLIFIFSEPFFGVISDILLINFKVIRCNYRIEIHVFF